MRSAAFLLFALAVAVSASHLVGRDAHALFLEQAKAQPEVAFKNWADGFSKLYGTLEEFEHRLAVWKDNLEFVLAHNADSSKSYTVGLNVFADLTYDEFAQHAFGYNYSMREQRLTSGGAYRYEDTTPPPSIDWREQKAVAEVKNQAQCGSCWAFSAVGAMEGINAIVSGELLSLSEQELVDCDRVRDQGCHGGLMDYAYQFVIDNGGLDTEKDYPYRGADDKCLKSKMNRKVVTIDGYEDVPPNNEKALKKAVANQPVSVAIEADGRTFQLYSGGVYDDATCGTNLNHGVLIVGYGEGDAQDGSYWIVKNSWGPYWGESGYINMKMGEGEEGLCGIAMVASYPVKQTPNPPMPGPPAPEPKPTPAPPGPVTCPDGSSQCPPGNTCCCALSLAGYCFSFACCPLKEATCCDDQKHCCPQDLPVCDTVSGRCMAAEGVYDGSVEWSSKTPATSTWHGLPWPFRQRGEQVLVQ